MTFADHFNCDQKRFIRIFLLNFLEMRHSFKSILYPIIDVFSGTSLFPQLLVSRIVLSEPQT